MNQKLIYALIFSIIISGLSFAKGKKTKFSVSLGVVSTYGNSETTTFRGSIDYAHKGDIWRRYLNASGLYSESKGKKTAERFDLWGRLERRFLPYFVFWDVDYYRNPFQGYAYSLGTGPGIGRYLAKTKKLYFSVSYYVYGIYNRLTDEYTGSIQNKIERYLLHHIEERFRIKITDNLKFKQRIVYKQTSRGQQDYFITADNSLENKLLRNLSLEISYNLNYQNRPVEQNIKRLDTIFITSVKYTF